MKRKGFTLMEIVVSMSIFFVLLTMLGLASRLTTLHWKRNSGKSTVQGQLKKAQHYLVSDLMQTSFAQLATTPVPASIGGFDGDAVWFLTSQDPATGEFVIADDGTAHWLRNILYYTTVPIGDGCGGSTDSEGYENECPHKLLVRKVIDFGPPTNAGTETEALIPVDSIGPYLTRPNGFSVTTMSEPGLENVTLSANSLTSLRCWIESTSSGEVQLELQGGSTRDGFRSALEFSVFPP